MNLTPGLRLGPYQILSLLGSGGMGEVYRARDTRLGREVAIKVVHPRFAAEAEHLRRFEKEARAASQLDHPNILVVHDVGTYEGSPYIVSELLQGESLREKLGSHVPPGKAIEYALQVARGLAVAHEKGIVHRDIKPENLFVTKDGRIKILDFGIAKLAPSFEGPRVDTQASTDIATQAGTAVGTVAYMSPEQAQSRAVDFRSDQFSLGVVLYEMLTGKRPFRGASAAETLAAILREEPEPVTKLVPTLPAPVGWIVQRCLSKDPEERYSSTLDLAKELQNLRMHLSEAVSATGVVPVEALRLRRRVPYWALAVIALAAVLGVAGLVLYRKGEKAGRRSAAEISFRQMSFRPQTIFQAAFAPDGETIVYSAALEGNVPELFSIRPEYPEPRPLGLSRTHLLSISSKGELAVLRNARFTGFRFFTGTLARVPLGSTAPREILQNVSQAAWSPDGTELAIVRFVGGMCRLEFPIGKVLYETAGWLSDLRVSPRGDRIALFEHPKPGDDRGSVILVDRTGKRTLLSGEYEREEGLSWSLTGDEVLFTASTTGSVLTLWGVDLSGHRRVALRSAGGLTMHDVSRTGRWLVTRDDFRAEISVLAPGATAERDLSWLDLSFMPFLSRDGRMLSFTDQSPAAGPNYRVCLRTTDGGPVVVLGEGMAYGFSPNAKWVLATIDTPPQLLIYPTGPGEMRHLPRGNLVAYHWASWYPDGNSVLVAGDELGKAPRCYAQDLSGGLPRPVTPEGTANCSVSPDGLRLLYSTAGNYVIQGGVGEAAEPVSGLTNDEWVVRWSADGRSLYLYDWHSLPFRLERLDLASGRRVLIREVAPADRAGVLQAGSAALADDARSYAYGYVRMPSQLFIVEGAR
jgi:eukaryotic-like serine/threonine-protein kinase